MGYFLIAVILALCVASKGFRIFTVTCCAIFAGLIFMAANHTPDIQPVAQEEKCDAACAEDLLALYPLTKH